MSKNNEVEYCNLEIRFERPHIRNFIKSLIREGYSLYWSELDGQFIISIRIGRKLIKLKFERIGQRYKIVGNYSFKDEKLMEIMEKMICDTRGHAIVKRFRDRQILIENIMFGETIRMVEITGFEHRILYQKDPPVSIEDLVSAFRSQRIEERIPVLRLELDYELAILGDAIQMNDAQSIDACKKRLNVLRQEMILLEM